MLLPFSYAVRNLYRDRTRLLQTLGGSALVVFLVMGAHALNEGMRRTLNASGSASNMLIIGKGSEESVQRSEVSERAAGIAEASLSGIHAPLGERAVSPQIVHMTDLTLPDGRRMRGLVRGVNAKALLTHPEVALVQGGFPGSGEVMAGRLAWKRFGVAEADLAPGKELKLDTATLTVSGTFAAPGTVLESEIWMDINDLRTLAQRETISAVVVRLDTGDPADVQLFTRQRLDLELSAVSEKDYYARLAAFYAPVRAMTWTTAALIAAAAVFGGFNTLYAAFASRVREIATLQAIGFRRLAIVISFIQESLMTALLGSLLGAIVAVLMLADRVVYLSAGAFRLGFGPETLFAGLATGALLGLLGAIPPAIRCLKPNLPQALRD
ncbi:MAG TPA: ABC transporter permease [Kiritimatiellia bacterium]|mgnify:CR=1 FL=1|nr:ABC transporter permease [Kiritimatiellia bacterium]HMO99044.1 ABC transporter permease [Kiritimatiellia bacterium]HMP96120.1 ABC transporter permease [Kiritimatiellia bacterium]